MKKNEQCNVPGSTHWHCLPTHTSGRANSKPGANKLLNIFPHFLSGKIVVTGTVSEGKSLQMEPQIVVTLTQVPIFPNKTKKGLGSIYHFISADMTQLGFTT